MHPLAIQDAQRERHPPKIKAFESHTFILLKGLSADTQNIDFHTIQLAFFVDPRFLLTRHSGQSLSINRLVQRLSERDPDHYCSPAKLTLQLCRLTAERYLNILLVLETHSLSWPVSV